MRSLDRLFKSRLNGTGLKPLVQYIKDLFSNNEQGVWYDPSDLTTLYQDAAGTIPVTAVEQPVGLMLDKSRGLALGSELVTNGTFETPAGWKLRQQGVDAPPLSGAGISGGVLNMLAANGQNYVAHTDGPDLVVGKTYVAVFDVVSSTTAAGIQIGTFNPTTRGWFTSSSYIQSIGRKQVIFQCAYAGRFAFWRFAAHTGDVAIDNVSVRELPGNHASQITATSRPVLSARVNLLTETEFRNGITDAPTRGGLVSAASLPGYLGAIAIGYDGSTITFAYKTNYTVPTGTPHTIRLVVRMDDGFPPSFIGGNNSSTRDFCLVAGGAVISSNEVVKDLGNNTYQVTATVTTSTANANCGIIKYAANSSRTFKITAIDVRPSNTGTNLPDYQRVNTATGYDTAGFPYFLRMDGVDDFLVTPSIDFTSTDKVSLFAGIRKLSDAAVSVVAELSSDWTTNNGAFVVHAPRAAAEPSIYSGARASAAATALQAAIATSYSAPVTAVLASTHDLAGDLSTLRVNAVAANSAIADKGVGNFGNYPLYIGRKGGTSLPFNGHLYSLIIRGAATSDSQIKSVERYVNTKTRAYTT